MRKPVRFSLLGRFQRMCLFALPLYAIRNNRFSSWSSLFFYRCTDRISFARLKSQDISSRLSKISALPTLSEPQPSVAESTETGFGFPKLSVVDAPVRVGPVILPPIPQQVWGFETLETHFHEKPVAAVLPTCSPKSIYVLASLVRRPSIGCIGRDTNASNQARNPTPP